MPAGESEARAKTKARFDEVLKRYTDAPKEKKKSKKKSTQPEESIALETLTKNLGLNKGTEDDETILKNTYQPDQSSPRYIKNRLREKELSEKVNNDSEVPEGGKPSQGRKKGKRDLPIPPPKGDGSHPITRADEDGSGSARLAVLKAVREGDEARGRKAGNEKKGKRKGKREDGAREREVEADDKLLQEYQQQIAREEQRAGKATSSKKPPARRSSPEQEVALNNDTERKKMKKKKLRSQETRGDAG